MLCNTRKKTQSEISQQLGAKYRGALHELTELLAAPTPAITLTRAADSLRYTDPASGVQRQTLAHPAPGLQWLLYTLPAGAQSKPFAAHASGTRETFHVLAGAVQISAGGQTLNLRRGDTAQLRADTEHHFRNTGRSTAQLMLLIAQPRTATLGG